MLSDQALRTKVDKITRWHRRFSTACAVVAAVLENASSHELEALAAALRVAVAQRVGATLGIEAENREFLSDLAAHIAKIQALNAEAP